MDIKYIDIRNDPEEDSYDVFKPTLYYIEYVNGSNIAYTVDYITETAYIDAINVPAGKQGIGIGTAIVKETLSKHDYCAFGLNAKPEKATWWERFGFRETYRDETWIYMRRKASEDSN